MRSIFLIFTIFFLRISLLNAQKPIIDTSVLGKWPSISNPCITDDGNYASYFIDNEPIGNKTLIVKRISDNWEKKFVGASDCVFSADNKQVIISVADTIYTLSLGTDAATFIAGVDIVKWPAKDKRGWFAYQLSNDAHELVLANVITRSELKFQSVTDFSFSDSGKALALKTEVKSDSMTQNSLQWLTLTDGKLDVIWSSSRGTVNDYSFDLGERKIAFTVLHNDSAKTNNMIWYYELGMDKAVALVDDNSVGVDKGLTIFGKPQFSKNGEWIFFKLKEPDFTRRTLNDKAKVDVWSYKDLILQPEQMRLLGPKEFSAAVNIKGSRVTRIEGNLEKLITHSSEITGDYVVISDKDGVVYWWKFDNQPSFYLVSLKDGARKVLKKNDFSLCDFSFSPHGKYLVYYDWKRSAYFSYETETGKVRNISQAIPTGVANEYSGGVVHLSVAFTAGWHENDSSLLIYDNYDIWELDPMAIKSPINVTNGYGNKHLIKLNLVYGPGGIGDRHNIIYKRNDTLLITGFSPINKYNGFYKKILNRNGNPELLTYGPYTFYRTESQKAHYYAFDNGMQPIKALTANAWIVKRQTATDAPNYYFSKDLRSFTRLTDLQPQKKYNWLTTELITWRQQDGSSCQGILYKPENFDPKKKYPIILNYYEKLSHRLYEFPKPNFTNDNINIPWFVSNGYLVFTPDIHYSVASKTGKVVGEHAYNSVVSGANFLSKLPYVDGKSMAIQAHSFGALQTNYIVTHTSLFAAAAEFAGSADPISAYLTLVPLVGSVEHFNKQTGIELGHELYGCTPWQRPDLYRKNSAVLSADKVTTPLLIVHNKKDNQVQWRQGVELYMALRRLGKRVWMLQYDEGTHVVYGKNAVDYSVRLSQFFDHYLKRANPPKWMTEGVSATQKDIDTGLDLDYSGRKP